MAANKETKRIMMRDGMKEIAAKIVEAAHCCSDDMVEEDKKGAARVFVTGKSGVGKVRGVFDMHLNFILCLYMHSLDILTLTIIILRHLPWPQNLVDCCTCWPCCLRTYLRTYCRLPPRRRSTT